MGIEHVGLWYDKLLNYLGNYIEKLKKLLNYLCTFHFSCTAVQVLEKGTCIVSTGLESLEKGRNFGIRSGI